MAALLHPSPPAHSMPASSTPPVKSIGWRDAFRVKLYGLVALAAILLAAIQIYSITDAYHRGIDGKVA